jgi:hypothetical protein
MIYAKPPNLNNLRKSLISYHILTSFLEPFGFKFQHYIYNACETTDCDKLCGSDHWGIEVKIFSDGVSDACPDVLPPAGCLDRSFWESALSRLEVPIALLTMSLGTSAPLLRLPATPRDSKRGLDVIASGVEAIHYACLVTSLEHGRLRRRQGQTSNATDDTPIKVPCNAGAAPKLWKLVKPTEQRPPDLM